MSCQLDAPSIAYYNAASVHVGPVASLDRLALALIVLTELVLYVILPAVATPIAGIF